MGPVLGGIESTSALYLSRSLALMVEPPRYFQYLSANLAPRTSSSTTGMPYLDFANLHEKRRRVLLAGANDGFLHAFDGGVWGRDVANFPDRATLKTVRTPAVVASGVMLWPPLC